MKAFLRRSRLARAAARAVVTLSELTAASLELIPGNPAHGVFAKHGFHLLRKDYYLPIPDEDDLDDAFWSSESDLVGLEVDDERTLRFLDDVFPVYAEDFRARFPIEPDEGRGPFYLLNGRFMAGDADVYYAFVRHFRPKRVIEIGAGYSTLVALEALADVRRTTGDRHVLTAVDPFPPPFLDLRHDSLELIEEKVQRVPLELFGSLEAGDILFIDSSHVLRAGGDVQHEYCEILPRLRPGVLVHVHDISLPKPYPRVYFEDHHWYWNEQYVLQAFLAFNRRFEIVWPGTYMAMKHRDRLEEAFPALGAMRAVFPLAEPSSFWIRAT